MNDRTSVNTDHKKGCIGRYGANVSCSCEGKHLIGCPGKWNPNVSCSCAKTKRIAKELLETSKVEAADERQNPKLVQALKDGKVPMEYLVYSVLEDDARCHKGGADRYGVRNWLEDKILASTYEAAILRHFLAWARGEDKDPDDGLSPLTHIRACCAIVLDAEKHGTLIDDRDRVENKDKTTGE